MEDAGVAQQTMGAGQQYSAPDGYSILDTFFF
jgi:hypothetical protein